MRAWKKMRRSWRRSSIGQRLSIGATVILALSIVGVLATERFDSANQDDAVQTGAGRATEKTGDDVKAAGKPLELGTVTKISSNYRVSVAEVTKYEIPTGWLIVPTVRATYIGHEDGEPWADLNVEFFGTGSRSYGESDCPAGLDHGDAADDRPTLANGDDATYDVCIDVPVKAVKGGKVLVEEAFSTDDHTFWSIKGAVTKTLPSPQRSVQPNPAARAQRPQVYDDSDDDLENACEKYKDNVEEYKDNIDDMDDRMDAYKKAPGHDDDKVEDYEDWKDGMEKIISQYEERC